MEPATIVLPRRCVLLIDDSVAERDLYEFVLEADFDIATANRGDEGITIARQPHPDAIVLDVMMPGMDGGETCTRIKCLTILSAMRSSTRDRCQ